MKHISQFLHERARSLDEFVALLKKNGCQVVRIEPRINLFGFLDKVWLPALTDPLFPQHGRQSYTYVLELVAMKPSGRFLYYTHICFARLGFAEESFVGEGKERIISDIRQLLIAEEATRFIKTALPEIRVNLISPRGEVMDEKMNLELQEYAVRRGITAGGIQRGT